MHRSASLTAIFLTTLSLTLLVNIIGRAQDEVGDGWEILEPQPGQPILGILSIEAVLHAPDTAAVEVSFAYADDPTETWFLIGELNGAPSGSWFIDWDTSRLTDSMYTLRLTAVLNDGRKLAATIPGLRVRNYTQVETATPTQSATHAPAATPTPALPAPVPAASATITPIPETATPLPINPAVLTEGDLSLHLALGMIGAGAFFAVLGLYASLLKFFRR